MSDLDIQHAIYTRLSQDRDGTQTATARQEYDARKYAADRGWTIGVVYTDVDLSAYDRRVRRDGFEQLLAALASGDHAGVVVWKIDRLVRQPRDLERVLDALEAGRAGLASVHDPVDVSGPMGLAMLRIGVVMASVESANISLRSRRKAEELARAGAPVRGGTRAFGYTRDRSRIVPAEAEAIRWAAAQILAGESTRGVARAWNDAGIGTTTGRQWVPNVVSRMLRAPLLAGLRQHHGEVVATGAWPAILDRDTHDRLAVILDPRARRTTVGRPRRYLFTGGIARCGLCGHPLVARPREDGRRRYVCQRIPGRPGCGRITIGADDLEAVVTEAALARIAAPGFADELAAAQLGDERGDLLGEAAQLEQRLEELAVDHYATAILSRAEYEAARSALVDRLDAVRARLGRLGVAGILTGLPSGEDALRAAWTTGSIEWRRRLLGALTERVTIGPAVRGRNYFDSSRVDIVWREHADNELRDAA